MLTLREENPTEASRKLSNFTKGRSDIPDELSDLLQPRLLRLAAWKFHRSKTMAGFGARLWRQAKCSANDIERPRFGTVEKSFQTLKEGRLPAVAIKCRLLPDSLPLLAFELEK